MPQNKKMLEALRKIMLEAFFVFRRISDGVGRNWYYTKSPK
jgi:hypothetical protein